jgi:elongation factor G
MKAGMRAFNPGKDVKENIPKLFHVHADPARGLEEVPEGPAGDIVCVLGLKDTTTGDTLCETPHPILLEAITFAQGVVSQSIEPDSGGDKDKLGLALEILQLEDPTFKVKADKDTGQTLMSGMGTLHLEVKKHRLERDFKLKVRVGKPRVSFREMLREPRTVTAKIDRLGEKPAFAELKVSFTNFKSEKPVGVFNVVNTEANPVPPLFLASAEKALTDALSTGELGYPMMNAQARMLEAKFDPQLSSEDAFVAAAIKAYRDATSGNVKLLEPIMKVTVTTPSQFLGNITGDLAKRRGEIDAQDMSPSGELAEVVARVPLSELFTYANEVRSLSQGRAAANIEPHSYADAPPDVLRRLMGE